MKVKNNFWIGIIVLVVLIIFHSYLKDDSIERTIYFLCLSIASSYIITLISSNDIKLIRKTKETRQQVGHLFSEKYEIINNKNLPIIWATIIDESNLSKQKIIRIISWITGHRQREFLQRTFLEKRGVFSLGPTIIKTGDPFGFFENSTTFTSIEKIVILPAYSKLGNFPEPTGFLSGGVARKSRNTEVSPYAVSVRDYFPGDPLRRIDWKSTARLDKVMVKEFEEDPQSTVWVFVDCNAEYFYESKYDHSLDNYKDLLTRRNNHGQEIWFRDSFEHEISLAASVIDYYISNNRFVGFYSNNKKMISISPEGGVRQLDKVLELLATLNPSYGQPLANVILSQKNQLGNGSTIVIISSRVSDDLLESIKLLRQKEFSIIVITIDPKSYDDKLPINDRSSAMELLGVKIINVKNGHTLNEYIQDHSFISS